MKTSKSKSNILAKKTSAEIIRELPETQRPLTAALDEKDEGEWKKMPYKPTELWL